MIVFLDLRRTFNKVHLNILIMQKLIEFDVSEQAYAWLADY